MAATRNETQITWSAASSVTVSSATVVWSDAFLFHVDDWEAELQVNDDILGDSGNDYTSVEHSEWNTRLDTATANTPGEDPANRSFSVRTAPLGFKVGVSCPQAASLNIVVRARIVTHRGP